MKTVWDFDFLSSMPKMSTEQAKEEWETMKDSNEKSDQNKLKLLLARITFHEIMYVCNKYGFDEKFVFSQFNMKWILKFCSGRDLNRGFFWADLYEAIRDRSMSLYVQIHKKWIQKDVFYRVRNRIQAADNRTREEIINDILRMEGTNIDLESVNIILDDIQREKEREVEEEKLREAFMNCDFAMRFPDNDTREYLYYKLSELKGRKKEVLIEYFGLKDGRPKEIDEICSQLDLPKEGVVRTIKWYYTITKLGWRRSKQLIAILDEIENENENGDSVDI